MRLLEMGTITMRRLGDVAEQTPFGKCRTFVPGMGNMRAISFALAVLALALLGCGGRPDNKAANQRTGPNVLFITLDTTRADRLGCYGYAEAVTPTLDQLAADGVRFERAYCQVPLTLPSHASMLTSLNPPTTGVRVNAATALSDEIPTIVERFKTRGYRTGAFIAAWVLHSRYGLARGFDHYDENFGYASDADAEHTERRADDVCDAVIAWLDQAPEAPFFAWVHLFDPHAPYEPPEGFREQPADAYDGEIAFMDSQLARLLKWLDAHGGREKTLVVAAGDHGEAFDEHGERGHGSLLYESTVRVPLIFAWPEKLPAGRAVSGDVRLIDLAPTILDLVGCESLPGAYGQSLRSMLAGGEETSLPIYGETDYPLVGFGWAPLRSYATREWKYIKAPRPELYDRVNDPGELTNVIAEQAEVAAMLKEELEAYMSGMQELEAVAVELDSDARRSLESLGYVGGSVADVDDRDMQRKDPKDMTAVFCGVRQAKYLALKGRHEEVIRLMEPLVVMSPESDELSATLAYSYAQVGRHADAERAYRGALRMLPENADRLCHLADAIAAQNRADEALEWYKRAAGVDDTYAPALGRIGRHYFQCRDFDRARKYFERCLALEPDSPEYLSNMAHIWLNTGNPKKATTLFRRALQQDPLLKAAHQGLWMALNAQRERLAAIEALRGARQVMPSNLDLQRHLAALLATTPQLGRAGAQEALALSEQLVQAAPDVPENGSVLALTCAVNGDFSRASQVAQEAFMLAQQQGNAQLAQQLAAQLQAYRAGRIQ